MLSRLAHVDNFIRLAHVDNVFWIKQITVCRTIPHTLLVVSSLVQPSYRLRVTIIPFRFL